MNNTNHSIEVFCDTEPLRTFSIVCDTIILVSIIALNLLAVICCLKYRRLRTYTNAFIVSLAICDFMFGMIVIFPTLLFKIANNPDRTFNCVLIMTGGYGSFLISLTNLMLISVERYLAVCRPFSYVNYVTYRSTVVSIVSCWLVNSTIIFLLAYFNKYKDSAELSCISTAVFPSELMILTEVFAGALFVLAIWCYFHVINVVRKQLRVVHAEGVGSPGLEPAKIRTTIMMIIMFGLFLGFLLPVPILKSAEKFFPSMKKSFLIARCVMAVLVKVYYFTNPLVYHICNKVFRKATKHLLTCSKTTFRLDD